MVQWRWRQLLFLWWRGGGWPGRTMDEGAVGGGWGWGWETEGASVVVVFDVHRKWVAWSKLFRNSWRVPRLRLLRWRHLWYRKMYSYNKDYASLSGREAREPCLLLPPNAPRPSSSSMGLIYKKSMEPSVSVKGLHSVISIHRSCCMAHETMHSCSLRTKWSTARDAI